MSNPFDRAEVAGSKQSSLGDLGNVVASASGDVASAATSSVQWLSDIAGQAGAPTGEMSAVLNNWRNDLNAFSAGRMADVSQDTQDMLNNPLNLHDLRRNPLMYLGSQLARQAPALAATIAAVAITRNPALGAGIVGGTLTAGDAINQVYSTLDSIPDEELQNKSQLYAGFRSQGMDEQDARAKLRVATLGAAPAVLAAIGATANIMGGAGEVGRLMTGSTVGRAVSLEGKNIVQRALIGGAVAGAAGAIGGGASSAVGQVPLVAAKLQNFNTGDVVNAALSGGVMGAALGATADALMGGGHAAEVEAPLPKIKPSSTEIVQPGALSADEQAAMAASAPALKIPEVTPEGNPPATETQTVQPPANVPAPAPVPDVPQQVPTSPVGSGAGSVADTGVAQPIVAPEPAAVAKPPTKAAPASSPEPTQAAAPVAAPAPQPEQVTPPSHDAVFSAAAKTATIAKALQKIADITGAPVEQVRAALKNQTVGKDVPGIRETAKTWLANAKPLDDTAGAKHRTSTETQVRADANETAKLLTDRFGPNPETEGSAVGSANDPNVKQARVALAKRVGKMADAAQSDIVKPLAEQNVEFPTRFKDNTDKSSDWNEHVMLLSEAQRLNKKIANKSATSSDYQRFLTREADLRGGNKEAVKAERRAEGEQAFRKGVVDTTGDVLPPAEGASGTDIEAPGEQVQTKIPKSAKKPIAEGKTGPASKVRKVALSAEEKAAIERTATERAVSSLEKLPQRVAEKLHPDNEPKQKAFVEKVKAKAAAKQATVKQRVAAAAKQVETKPTPAQAEAGNYAKGHVSIHGLDIAIENPRGSTRTGTGPDGKPWSVKMPDHYGYIKRTAGADGDHVDVYVGPHPESEHVFLVEQRHAETGAFDEHKAMLGYDSAAQAMSAYERAFSDGKAADRFGSVKPMSVDEFKTWLKEGDTTKPTDEYKATEKSLASEREKITVAQTREGVAPTPYVRARNAVANWLNGLSDRDYHDLEAAHFSRPIEETDGQSIPQMLDNADSPAELGKIYRDLKALHEQAHPVTSEVPVPPHTDGNPLISKMGNFDEKVDQQAREMYRATKDYAGKTLAFVREHGERVDANELLDISGRRIETLAAQEAQSNADVADKLVNPWGFQSKQRAVQSALAPTIISRLKALAGDVQTYVLPDDKFYSFNKSGVLGYYDPTTHSVVFPRRAMDGIGAAQRAHVVIHELVHAAFKVSTENNPIAKGVLSDLMAEAKDALINELPGHTYAFTNEHEFIAEALSNPALQETLGSTPLSDKMATRLGLAHRMGTVWDGLVAVVRKVLGLPTQAHSLLDGVMRVADAMDTELRNSETGKAGPFTASDLSQLARNAARQRISAAEPAQITTDAIGKTISDIKDAVESSITGKGLVRQLPGPKLLSVRTFDQIAAVSKRYFKGNPVRAAFNAVEGMRVAAMKVMQGFEPEIMAIHRMADKYAGPVFDDFAALMHDSTMAGVFPNEDLNAAANSHIAKTGHTGEWQRAQHAELKAKFDALPEDLKNTYINAVNFFRDKQNQLALGTMQNRILKALGVEDNGMAARLFSGTETDADKNALGPAYDVVKQAGELSKIDGPYFPLMRRGTHVVTGEHAVADPTASTGAASYQGRGPDGEYIFGNKDDAGKFAAKDEKGQTRTLRPTIKTVYVDAQTGAQFGREADGTEVRLTAKDPNAVAQYRVSIQNKHVEFVDGLKAAEKLHYDLEQAGLKNVDHQERMVEPGRGRGDMLSTEAKQVMKVIEQRDAYKGMSDTQKFEVQQALQELSLRFLGSTRIQSRALPRRYVAGASRDVVRNTYEYAQSVANYLGKLEHAPALEKAMSAMQDEVRNDYTKDTSLGKSQIYNEVLRRVTNFTPLAGDTDKFSAVTKRFMALSFLDKLFSPSHSVINAMQPAMLSFPTISGRHGLGKTFAAMSKAYDDIGALKTIGHGLQKTVEHATKPSTADLATFVEDIMGRVKNAGERSMLQFLVDHGTIDPDAGFEVNRMISSSSGIGGALDTGINYMDGIARQLPRAVETINRAVTGLAAYRLEMARTGDHEAAVAYAQEVTNLTQGIYSSSNAPPVFNNPLLRLSLQFKKYGQLVYGLIGHHIGKAMANAEPGDRMEAFKTLGTMAALHIAIAGTLGLPTEPFKWLLLGANFAGLTKYKWEDVENWERQVLAHIAGKQVGEVLSRGITRALPGGLAFDLSGRVGLNDLMSFGEPQSNSPQDLASYFGTLIMGAPGSLALDYIKAAQKVSAGDFTGAAQLMIPMKAAADGIAAYQKMTTGKVNKYGNQTMQPYSLQEAMVRTFGFTPAREAETGDAQANFYNVTERNKAQVQSYQQQWAAATPGQRMRLWATIERYNQTANAGNKLTRAQLDSFARNKAAGVTSGKVSNGLQVNSKTRSVLDANSAVYATQ